MKIVAMLVINQEIVWCQRYVHRDKAVDLFCSWLMKLAPKGSRFPFISHNILFTVTSSIKTQLQSPCMGLCECEGKPGE